MEGGKDNSSKSYGVDRHKTVELLQAWPNDGPGIGKQSLNERSVRADSRFSCIESSDDDFNEKAKRIFNP